MPSTSFQRGSEPIPPDYRTPSPPLRFHEPLSPAGAAGAAARAAPARRTSSSHRGAQNPAQTGTTRRKRKSSKNGASQNAMDNFASFVLSANGSPSQAPARRDARGTHTSPGERPAKRSKSYHMAEISTQSVSPPEQAQWSPSAVPVADAELLLNFSQRACSQATPVNRSLSGASAKLRSVTGSDSTAQTRTPGKRPHAASPNKPANPITSQRDQEQLLFGPALERTEAASKAQKDGVNGIGQASGASDDAAARSGDSVSQNGQEHGAMDAPRLPKEDSEAQLLRGMEETAMASSAESADPAKTASGEPGTADASRLKPDHADSPSVCAGCNFHRNTSLREAEFEVNSWISCDGCRSWFHFACAGFKNEREVRGVDKFRCKKCKSIHGPTTFVRKSSRAHSAIDYAGLNEGIVKTSDESPEHHYIKPIKDGTIKFDPETFARMRPELATRAFFEKGDGMKEPVVIPAAFNPRPRFVPDVEMPLPDEDGASNQEIPDVNDASALDDPFAEQFEYDQFDDEGQDSLGMVIPQDLTVRKVSELYGPEERIEVIDVKSQNGEDKRWNMKRWVDYYESTGSKVVRNVISLEVSQSRLGRLIRRPQVVRDLDLQDAVWPADLLAKGDYPKVQFYCLMSVADCYTDFHIDFGGSSVYYHILKGKKTFFFIPPHEKHLKKYEEWCNSPAQNWTFLGDQTKECYRVDLSAGDTMLIPAGWIHAVWTPEDSLVIGGNFLTRMHYGMQIRVAQIEKATHVARKFRYPFFQKIMWYTALRYLEEDPLPESVGQHLISGQEFHREIPTHFDYDGWGEGSAEGPENYHRRYYSKAELDGLPELCRYLQRTALIAMGSITEGISVETRNAVKRSIPKTLGDPLETVKKFALWYTWKRGNETIPHWAYPDYVPEGSAPEVTEKKLSARTIKRLDREAALLAWKIAPDRQSTRVRTQPQNFLAELASGQLTPTQSNGELSAPSSGGGNSAKRKVAEEVEETATPSRKPRAEGTPRSSGPRRPACEACRKSRRACKHRDELTGELMVNGTSPPGAEVAAAASSPTSQTGLHTLQVELVHPNGKAEGPANENSSPIANHLGVTTIIQTKSSGRNKACKECRKSKRRCVHDEFGNDDPVKLAEAALPRPPTKKRKSSGDAGDGTTPKKPKKPQAGSAASRSPMGEFPSSSLAQAIAAQALSAESAAALEAAVAQGNGFLGAAEESSAAGQEAGAETRAENGMGDVVMNEENGEETGESIEEKEWNEENAAEVEDTSLVANSPATEKKYNPAEAEAEAAESRPAAANSLVSPPESTHTDAERTPPAAGEPTEPKEPAALANGTSAAFAAPTGAAANRYTPDSGPQRRASTTSAGKAAEGEAVSPGAAGALDAAGKVRAVRLGSEPDADPESMRLIRELAAQDMGLRRRGKGM